MIDRSRPPEPLSVRPFAFPRFSATELESGLQVIAAPLRRVPLVLLRLICPSGAENDPPEGAGLAALTAALIDEGTDGRSSFDLAAAAERLGGYLMTGAGWNSAFAETSLLERDLELGLEILADVTLHPTFPQTEIDRLRQQSIGQLRRRRMQPATAANDAFNRALYGEDPYGRPILGDEASLAKIDRDRIIELHRRRFRPGGSTLVAVGDFETDRLQRLVFDAFGPWTGRAAEPNQTEEPATPPQRRVVLVDRAEAPQSEICIGHAGPRRGDPDFLVFSVMNALFGGKFTSRINLNLRERHGFTYGAHSRYARRRGPGPFVVQAAVDNDAVVPAIREVLSELERLRNEEVPEAELRETVDYLIGSFPYTCETLAGVGARLSDLAVHDLPHDYYARLPEALRAITPGAIQDCARDRLHPDRALVVVAGPADAIATPITEIGPLERAEDR